MPEDESPPKMAKHGAPESEPAWMNSLIQRFEQSVSQQVGTLREDVNRLSAEQEATNVNISSLQDRMDVLEEKAKESSAWPPLASSFSLGCARPSPTPSIASQDTAVSTTRGTVLKVRNFCDFGDWKANGVERQEAEVIMHRLRELLPGSLKSQVLDFELRNRKNYEITVPIRTVGASGEIMSWWKEALREEEALKFKSRVLYVVPERPEHLRPLYAKMGKLKEKLLTVHRGLEGAPFTLQDSWYPNWTISAKVPTGGETVLVKISPSLELVWSADAMTKYFKEEAQPLME